MKNGSQLVDMETGCNNIRSVYRQSTIRERFDGMDYWCNLGTKLHQDGRDIQIPFYRKVAVFCALSPNNS